MSYDFQTSYPAYKEGGKDYCRQQVFLTIQKLGKCTDRMIADKLGWEINRITPRRLELVDAGKVECYYKAKDLATNRTVNYWRIKELATNLKQASFFN